MPYSASAPSYYRAFETGGRIPSGAFDLGGSYARPGGEPLASNEQARAERTAKLNET
jgi:hypothetical protein